MTSRRWKPPPLRLRAAALLLLFAATALLSLGEARSPHPPPLRRLAHPSSSRLEILPRHPPGKRRSLTAQVPLPNTLRYDDTVLLTLSLPNLLPFAASLLLKPSEHIFHPQAQISYGHNGHSEALRQDDWRLYTGQVIHPRWVDWIKSAEVAGIRTGWEDDVAVVGTASVMVHETGDGKSGNGAVFEGSFSVYGTTYTVMTRDKYLRVKTPSDVDVEEYGSMVVFRDSDMSHDPAYNTSLHDTTHSCSHDALDFNSDPSHPVLRLSQSLAQGSSLFPMLSGLWRRDDTGGMTGSSNFINSINSTSGCPDTQKIVYMGVALDCNYVATYGSTDAARTQVLNDWNQISALYKSTFNISLGIIELQVQNATCPTSAVTGLEWNVGCSTNLTLDERLSLFSEWRGTKGDDGAGLWHLMSACPTDSEVGVAWLGTLCQTTSSQQSGSTVSGTGISTATKTEWSLVAHEIGHGFGAIHDCTSGCSLSGSCCPYSTSSCDAGGKYIMNPTTSSTEQTFSGCTLGNICTNIGNKAITTTCIQTPGSQTVISLQQCGNGIVEDGEDCDPGTNATSSCCDSSTCKFLSGAVCDPTNSACCTSSCQLASAGTVCRSAVDAQCDYAETCTGSNATCPADKTVADGTSCGSNGLACASGTCTSLNLQCQLAGSSMSLTTACGQKDDTSCVVSCKDPNATDTCVVLQTELVDGSPCGYGGHCYNSTCQAGSWQDTAAAWYKQNLNISVPVTVVGGLIILAILFAIARCIFRSCTSGGRGRGNGQKGQNGFKGQGQQAPHSAPNMAYAPPGTTGPPPPPGPGSGSGSGTYGPFAANMSQLPPFPPPAIQRHSDSIASADPLMYTGVVSREPSPAPAPAPGTAGSAGAGGSQPGYNHNHNTNAGYLAPQANSGQGQWNNPYASASQGGWVDPRGWNGENYGRHEAYGR